MDFPVYKAITERRTVRRFKQQEISDDVLEKLVNAARLAPSASNLQPLEYIIVNDSNKVKEMFETLKWAGYIAPRGNPKEGEKPTAYIVVLKNNEIKSFKDGTYDSGASIENICLAAWEENIGTCWICSVDREAVRKLLDIPEKYFIDSVVAMGYKGEDPELKENTEDPVKYWKDEKGGFFVPKRKIKDVLRWNKF